MKKPGGETSWKATTWKIEKKMGQNMKMNIIEKVVRMGSGSDL
jgi:hypothetical protein